MDASFTKMIVPPKEPLQIIYPPEEWFTEGLDVDIHQRAVRLDRGFYMFKKWWEDKNFNFSHLIEENPQYCLYGLHELKELVREMHQRIAPNQKINERLLVFGLGAMNLLNASLYATAVFHSTRVHSIEKELLFGSSKEFIDVITIDRLFVTQQLPAYLELKKNLNIGLGLFASWIDYPFHDSVPSKNLVEYVTSLNNPDGFERTPQTKASYIIHDRVNHMPFFYNDQPERYRQISLENDWISIFSLSKFLGFSGSRVGYAFVQDPEIARYMEYYITMTTHGIGIDGELRCIAALKYLIEGSRLESFIAWYIDALEMRWKRLRQALHDSKIELLNNRASNAWIIVHGENAKEYLHNKYNVVATYGPEYGVGDEFARLNLLGQQNEFDEFIYRLSWP